ncbi:MAG: CYTH domain-containing protein [Ruminococcaceae bacterium]|nr:CYTH domain-containing protein [Oscillospiraceae bacterium]
MTPLEIERKYLIEYPDIARLECYSGMTISEITQTYLIAPEGEERRVRARRAGDNVTYYHAVKRRVTAVTREESETVIAKAEYERLLSEADPEKRTLHKTRYCIPYEGLLIEIDIYPFWRDQAIAEVELKSEDAPVAFPPEIKVIREVTGEKAYKNAELAKK